MSVDGLDGTQVSLHGHEMAATGIDVHAAASINYFEENMLLDDLNKEALQESLKIAEEIFV